VSDPLPRQPEPEYMDDRAEAEAYAVADFADVNQAFVDRLIELVGPRERLDAVDLGTGPADIPIRVVRARPGWYVTAVDASAAMLAVARHAVRGAGLDRSIPLVLSDAKRLPLADASFDVVFSNSILHHITDTAAFWCQVRRLARPGAVVLLRDLARPDTADDARAIVRRYAGGESDLLQQEFYRSLLSAYRPDEVRRQLTDAGLTTLRVQRITDRHLDIFGAVPADFV